MINNGNNDSGRGREYGVVRKEYNKKIDFYKIALNSALRTFNTIKLEHQKKATLRIAYIDGRIKGIDSVIRKAVEKGYNAKEVFTKLNDIVGLRVVVNNLKDINILLECIKNNQQFKILEQDDSPGTPPYKAKHLVVEYYFIDDGKKYSIKCEIQLRTLLQDSWAILTHRDVYKNQANLPPLGQVIAEHLSHSLETLDRLANKFKETVEEKVIPPNDLSDTAPLNKQGIAFLYYELIGENPQDYEVEYLTAMVNKYGLKTIGEARKGLNDSVLEELATIHDERFPIVKPTMELVEYGIVYAMKGKSALSEYKRKIEQDWVEIERIGREDLLSELPETFDEFLKMVKDNEIPWDAIRELGGIGECVRCAADIFIPDKAAEAILDHYDNPDTPESIEELFEDIAFNNTGPFEAESVNTPGLCPYCDYVFSKDD